MTKLFFLILLALCTYIILTITPASRADITHTVAMIPHHVGTAFNTISEKATQLQDYHAETGD